MISQVVLLPLGTKKGLFGVFVSLVLLTLLQTRQALQHGLRFPRGNISSRKTLLGISADSGKELSREWRHLLKKIWDPLLMSSDSCQL